MILKIETVKNWHVRIRVLNVKNWDKKKKFTIVNFFSVWIKSIILLSLRFHFQAWIRYLRFLDHLDYYLDRFSR